MSARRARDQSRWLRALGPVVAHRPCSYHTAHRHRLLLSDVFNQAAVSRLSMGSHSATIHADACHHAAAKAERKPNGGLSGPLSCRPPRSTKTAVALRSLTWLTCRENSHANHTWDPPSHQTACFQASESPPMWVRFPSPAPLPGQVGIRRDTRLGLTR